MTPLILSALLLASGDAPPAEAPKVVPATRVEEKEAMEAHKKARPRLPAPPDGEGSGVNNARFRQYYLGHLGGAPIRLPAGGIPPGFGRDPAMTLDNTFKVKLFWIASRANNCYYCLGHQEQKLAVAGVSDDEIAALDADWSRFTESEQAAFAFTKKLTQTPHLVGTADINTLTKHYKPKEILEIVVTVAGYNATNRWTDGLNIPAEASGMFRREDGKDGPDLSKFTTPTSAKFKDIVSQVAPLPEKCVKGSPPVWPSRPALEDRATVEAHLKAAKDREAVLPLANAAAAAELWKSDGAAPQWVRLLAVFPRTGESRVSGMKNTAEKGLLPARVQAEIAWTAARVDRAWYALGIARDRLKRLGFSDDQIFALDGEAKDLPESERAAIAFARKLSMAPATVSDRDVEGLRKHFKDKEVAEIVHNVCNAAFLNRVTETARLPLDH
jgi:alkylhydroperoxidase family enzyme